MRSNGYMFQGLGTQDLKRLSQAKTARYLASRWGGDPETVSLCLAECAVDPAIARERQGKTVRQIAGASCKRRLAGPGSGSPT
jgi:hypothetical protein